MMHSRRRDEFASDNTAGICPEAVAALEEANTGTATAYGEDVLTAQVCDRVREIFERDCDVYLVFNGTAANALVLAQVCHSFHSVICHKLAHIQTDECGAPEFFSGGLKLLPVDGEAGKISLEGARAVIAEQHGVHSHKPQVISVTQATELGTVYSLSELSALADFAREHNLLIHMDGARFANAMVHGNCRPSELTWKAGVDVLCFGGTKNGIGSGELVVFFKPELARDFDYRLKQGGQLGSKMRFLAAQWLGLLRNDVWLRNADQANQSAQRLCDGLVRQAHLQPLFPVQSNAIFVRLPPKLAAAIADRGWNFYKFVEPDVYRFMCSWATSRDAVDEFVRQVAETLASSAGGRQA
jgi:threonine aldolase